MSWTIYEALSLKAPHSHFAPVATDVATFFAPAFSQPDSYFSWIFLMPFSPKLFVLPPMQKAFSLAVSNNSSGLISTKGMSSLQIYLPFSAVGWFPIYLPSRMPRQWAAALEVSLALISAFSRPQKVKKFLKLMLPPLCILSTSSLVQKSSPTLFTCTTQVSYLNSAAQLRQRNTPCARSVHCLLCFPHWKQQVFASSSKRGARDAESKSYLFSICIILYHQPTL